MENKIVRLGDSELSFKEIQEIYNDLTGKTESLSDELPHAFTIDFSDLEQLNAAIEQSATSHGAILQNTSVTVFHTNKNKSENSSFERFKIYNRGNTSPIENIYLEYNFLIDNQTSGKATHHKIGLHVTSTLALSEDNNPLANTPIKLRKMFVPSPIRWKISFVDYVVARSFSECIKEWADGLERKKESKTLAFCQDYSHWLRLFFAVTSSVTFLWWTSNSIENISIGTLEALASKLALIAAATICIFVLGSAIGRMVEHGIDRLQYHSAILINKGDERCFTRRTRSNLRQKLKIAGGLLSVISLNLISSNIATEIIKFTSAP